METEGKKRFDAVKSTGTLRVNIINSMHKLFHPFGSAFGAAFVCSTDLIQL
jgi:hypothetical protein